MPGAGNGDYRGELQRAIGMSRSYATHLGISPASILVRLDGLYGDAAPLLDVLESEPDGDREKSSKRICWIWTW
jgi:hypothetical protein